MRALADDALRDALGPAWASALATFSDNLDVMNFALFIKELDSETAKSILATIRNLREADDDAACRRFHGVTLVRLPRVAPVDPEID